jgi:hypothetical protein
VDVVREKESLVWTCMVVFGATGLSLYTAGASAVPDIQRELTLSFGAKLP